MKTKAYCKAIREDGEQFDALEFVKERLALAKTGGYVQDIWRSPDDQPQVDWKPFMDPPKKYVCTSLAPVSQVYTSTWLCLITYWFTRCVSHILQLCFRIKRYETKVKPPYFPTQKEIREMRKERDRKKKLQQ